MAYTSGNIIDYVTNRTASFEERPFNDVDALVLASLSYQRMPGAVITLDECIARYGTFKARLRNVFRSNRNDRQTDNDGHAAGGDDATAGRRMTVQPHRHADGESKNGGVRGRGRRRGPLAMLRELQHPAFPGMALADVYAAFGDEAFSHDAGFTGLADPERTEALYAAAAANPRFASIRVGAVRERFSEERQTQFAAVTMMLPDGTLAIVFRGTDTSFVGWKEDFNMAFQYPVPAQRAAADYVAQVAALWRGDIILLGHSKGGNLAVYAAMHADDAVRGRIRAAYSLDGPGFLADVVNGPEYRGIMDRIIKIVPDTSIVGMVLETPEPCRVVRSSERGVLQHDAFSWQVSGDSFVEVDDVAPSSRYFNQALNEWIAGLSVEQRESAVDAMFTVLSASEQKGLLGLQEAGAKSIPAMIGTLAELSDEDRRRLIEAATLLVRASLSISGPAHGHTRQ